MSSIKNMIKLNRTKIAIAVALLLVAGIVGILLQQNEVPMPEQFVVDKDGLRINTQYISLLYPIEYANDVMIDVIEDEGKSIVNVLATFAGVDGELFSLILSTSEGEGYKIGVLKQDDEEVSLFVRMGEWNVENWPEEEVVHLSRLQESVNLFLDQLYNAEGFASS